MDAALDYLAEQLRLSEAPLFAHVEKELFQRVLRSCGGDEGAAAKKLGVTKAALKKRVA
jgi:DNA-binding protein Fis